MLAASSLILWQGRDLSLSGDELHYYARLVQDSGTLVHYDGIGVEYLLAPHNGHLQLGGKLIYEAAFALAGPDYGVLRVLGLLGILLCVALVFELARLRVGTAPALAAAVLVLFLGAAWEVMLWPFDLHTTYALAAGLGALLVLERGGRRAGLFACLLLIGSVSMIEVGLGFLVGVGVIVLSARERASDAWVVAVPLALYAAWWLWARSFDPDVVQLSNLPQIPESAFNSLTAVLASLTGLFGTAPEVYPTLVGPDGAAGLLAAVVVACAALFLVRARPSHWFWGLLAALLAYWAFIGLADRPPDSSRYMLVGAILLLLLAAEAASVKPRGAGLTLALAALIAISLPAGLAKLSDGRDLQLVDARSSRAEYAMLELAAGRVAPDYAPSADPAVRAAGPAPFVFAALDARTYFAAAERVGSLAYSLEEVRALPEPYRRGADVTLAQALAVPSSLRPAQPPVDRPACRPSGDAPAATSAFDLPSGGLVVRPLGDGAVELSIGRFADDGPSFALGRLPPGRWTELRFPVDAAPDPWRVFTAGPIELCPP
jgi:hypothetical protein